MSWLRSMLTDGTNDTISSKRVIAFLAFLLCAANFIGELVFGHMVRPSTLDSMMYIVIAGLGFTASEKFTKSGDNK